MLSKDISIILYSLFRFNLHKRFSDKIFILNLAFADLLYCGINFPFAAYQYFYSNLEWGIFSCRLISNIILCNVFAEWMSLALVAASRCFSIIQPVRSRTFFSKRNLCFILILNRIYGFAILIPYNFGVSIA